MGSISNLRKSMFYLQQAIRNDHPLNKNLVDALDLLCEVKEENAIDLLDIKEIAKTYHERDICCGMSGGEQLCPTCGRKVYTKYSIEHDSRDFSKDLSICMDCYDELHKLWKENSPRKICPV
jgi:hypothetical protein